MRDAHPSLGPLVTLVIIASAVDVAVAGARDAEIAAAVKSRVEAKKAIGMVVATIEPDGSSSLGADMLKFARANLEPGGGRLQRVMQQTHGVRRPTGQNDQSIAMNWVITRMNGNEVVWHNGGTGGYRTWLGFDKARQIAAIVLTNSVMSNDDLGFELVAGSAK